MYTLLKTIWNITVCVFAITTLHQVVFVRYLSVSMNLKDYNPQWRVFDKTDGNAQYLNETEQIKQNDFILH